jgi:hypothetical protein
VGCDQADKTKASCSAFFLIFHVEKRQRTSMKMDVVIDGGLIKGLINESQQSQANESNTAAIDFYRRTA